MHLFDFPIDYDFKKLDLNQFSKCFYYFAFERFQNIYFDFYLILK
jgi:hypothetical protein